MKLTRKLKLRIVIGIAAVMILYGILDRFLNFNINDKTVNNVGMILMIAAFGLLFSRGDQEGNKDAKQPETNKESEQTSQQDIDNYEQTALENDMIKDQDKGATNNDNSRNDLRS